MKDPDRHELISRALRGELTSREQDRFDILLREDPSFRGDWQLERSLEKALNLLPDAPVSSNFTSLVLQAALKPEGRSVPRREGNWFRFTFAKLAAGLAAVILIAFSVVQQRQSAQRRELAEAVNTFNDVALAMSVEQTPSTEVFENFEAIQRLSIPAESELDMELLAALQK